MKEVKEESGYDVISKRLLAVLDSHKHPHPPQPYQYYKIFILCEIIGGAANIGMETNEIGFFAESNLPALSQNRNTASQMQLLFQFLADPLKETVLD